MDHYKRKTKKNKKKEKQKQCIYSSKHIRLKLDKRKDSFK